MKKYIYTTLVIAFITITAMAQPVSGFMGKRFATSLELEIVPGFQGSYEANTSEFLGFYTDYGYSYVPRLLANFEYQIKQRLSLSGAVGYAGMHVPIYYDASGYYYDYDQTVQPVQTVFFQVGFKKSLKKMPMPTASSYVAYRLGFYSISMDEFSVDDLNDNGFPVTLNFEATNAFQVALNFELGKRAVFNNGLFIDYGIAVNLSPSLFYRFKDEYESNIIEDPDYLEKAIKGRVACNSLFNFKVAVGILY